MTGCHDIVIYELFIVNRYMQKRPKMDANILDSDASEKREENSVSTFGQIRLWTSFEFSPVSVNRYRTVWRLRAM